MSDYKLTLKDYAKKSLGKFSNKLGLSCEGCQDDISVESILSLGTSAVTAIAAHNVKYGIAAGGLMFLTYYIGKHQIGNYLDKKMGWNHTIPY